MKTSKHFETGTQGEHIATEYLQSHGYRIITTNARVHPHDEIDIIARDPRDNSIVFCEVKTRTLLNDDYRPELNITSTKRKRMARAARGWVARNGWEGGYRMDVICIANGEVIEHYEEIAWPMRK